MKQKTGILCIVMTAFCFGTMEISLKIAGDAFTPFQLTFLRFMIGGLILLPFAVAEIRRRQLTFSRSDCLFLLLLGVINICISMILFQIGVQMSSAGSAAIVMSSNPIFTMIFSHFIVHDYFNRQKAITLVFGIAGLITVADPASFFRGDGAAGLLIVLLAAIIFAFYTTLGKIHISRLGGMVENSFSFISGSLVLLVINLIRHEPVISGISLQTLPPLLYTAIVVTGLGYMCYMKAIDLCGPSTASIAFFIKPVVALAGSALLLDEPITPGKAAGMLLIIAGCTLSAPLCRLMDRFLLHKSSGSGPDAV